MLQKLFFMHHEHPEMSNLSEPVTTMLLALAGAARSAKKSHAQIYKLNDGQVRLWSITYYAGTAEQKSHFPDIYIDGRTCVGRSLQHSKFVVTGPSSLPGETDLR